MRIASKWKALAKRYKANYEYYSKRPGHLLALMTIDERIENAPLQIMAAECMAWALQGLLLDHPEAKNYVEVTCDAPDGSQFFVTVQRPESKTPNQLKDDAVNERDIAWAEVENLEEVVQQDLVEYLALKEKLDVVRIERDVARADAEQLGERIVKLEALGAKAGKALSLVEWLADSPCKGNGSSKLCRVNAPNDPEWQCFPCRAHIIRYGE